MDWACSSEEGNKRVQILVGVFHGRSRKLDDDDDDDDDDDNNNNNNNNICI
jgi:hypothetical protein